jgi:hypothetical protein
MHHDWTQRNPVMEHWMVGDELKRRSDGSIYTLRRFGVANSAIILDFGCDDASNYENLSVKERLTNQQEVG